MMDEDTRYQYEAEGLLPLESEAFWAQIDVHRDA